MESNSDSEDEYGQMERPTLLGYLKQILEQYPNTSVLKEMLQNAEDARATEFKVMVFNDDVQDIANDDKYFEPPGLIIYNNAVFSERDWRGISSISNSIKLKDPSTVGKFGLGFKSVFHLTDYAVIISGDRLMIIDPFQPEERVIHKLSLKKISTKSWCSSFQKIKKGFSVFGFTDSNFKNNFSGTLFWFPLRQKSSALCNEVFSSKNMEQLLESFVNEAEMYLLFLLSVKQIKVLSFNKDDPLYEACTQREACVFSNLSVADYNNHLKTISTMSPEDTLSCTSAVECFKCFKGKFYINKWFVNHYFLGTNDCTNSQLFTLSKELNNSPCGGVAAPLSTNVLSGHTFCFLPLPFKSINKTGLPVHVNGFFALSPDRDHVKWAGEEENNATLEHSQLWNTVLIEEVVLKAYVEVILALCKNNEDPVFVYNLIPVENENTIWNWKIFISKLHKQLFEKSIFYTKNKGGSWLHKNHATFNIFLEEEVTLELGEQLEQSIVTALSYYDVNLVVLPDNIKTLLYTLDNNIQCITREYFVSILKTKEMKENGYNSLSPGIKEDLLYYLLMKNDLQILSGLSLLPLSNGQYAPITPRNVCQQNDIFWLCSKEELQIFPVKGDNFVGKLQCSTFDILKKLLDGNWNVNHLQPVNTCQVLEISMKKCMIKEKDSYGREYYMPGKHVVLTGKWLVYVWSYLSENNIIDKASDIPLLPLKWSDTFFQDQEINGLVSFNDNVIFDLFEHLSNNLVFCLQQLSIFVLKSTPQPILTHILNKFAKKLDEQILELIQKVCSHQHSKDIVIKFNSTTTEMKREFAHFLMQNNDLIQSSIIDFLRQLDIFPSGIIPNEWTSKLSSIACVQDYITFNDFPVSLPHEMLLLSENAIQHLAKRLRAKHSSIESVMLKTLISIRQKEQKYNNNEISLVMEFFIKNISMWDINCLNLAKDLQFLEDRNGEKRIPSEMFVSTPTLKVLFTYHPSKIVRDGYNENVLIMLDVKNENDLRIDDLLLIAHFIADNNDKQDLKNTMFNISHCLLNTIEKLIRFNHLQANCLKQLLDIKFVAHQHLKPSEYPLLLPWFGGNQHFSSPRDVKSLKLSSVLGSVCCLINDKSYQLISSYYQWISVGDPELILQQVIIIKENWSSSYASELLVTLNKIYKYMFKYVDLDIVKMNFEDSKLLFNGFSFFPPSRILLANSESTKFALEPYIGVLTDELLKYSHSLIQLGCMESLTVEKCKSVIKEIAIHHDNEEIVPIRKIEKDRGLVINLLQNILTIKTDENINDTLVPISANKLFFKPAYECTVYPISERRFCLAEEEKGHFAFVHEDVPECVCIGLNIPTFTQRFVSENNATELISDFGQQEPLTTRISNILDGYKDGVAVFKELVQNADDAGATDIMFMYDERKNDDSRQMLMSPGMAECQGPALWSFNNSLFSEEDFEHIIKLAGKTKMGDRTKIGKFGLGFCAVYNITDVPSLLSGDSLVIFDPHTTHLGQAIRDPFSPGLRLKLKGNKLLKRFSNQFKPYHGIFNCDILSETSSVYNGTLFRMPLRTERQSEKSKIKKKEYSKFEMEKLIQMFLSMAGNILLFTQNIKKIKFFHLFDGQDPSAAREIFSAIKNTKHMHVESPIQQTASILKKLSSGQMIKDDCWTEHVSLCMTTAFGKAQSSKTDWLISWYVETKKMQKLLARFNKNSQKALPLGAVAVFKEKEMAMPINDQMPYGLYTKSHIFCFLPLPGEYNIPVHINGWFEVNNERTAIVSQTGEEMETSQNEWNLSLLKNAVCNAYTYALVELAQGPKRHVDYWNIWPKDLNDITQELTKSFYQTILRENTKLFYQSENDRKAFSFNSCIFLSPDLVQIPKIGELAFKIFYTFSKSRGVPMKLHLDVYNCLKKYMQSDDVFERIITTEDFFRNLFLPNIQAIDGTTRNALLLFALKSKNSHILSSIKMFSCIPTVPWGRLRKPSEIIVKQYNSNITQLFTDEDERFTQKDFFSYEINTILKDLGAISDKLPSDLIIERANSIRTLPYPDACNRSLHILSYLQIIKNDELLYKALRNIPFITIMNCPSDWPLKWPSENKDTLCRPTDVYHSDCLKLCGCSQKILDCKNYDQLYNSERLFKCLCLKNVNDVSLEDVLTQVCDIDKLSITPNLQNKHFNFIFETMKSVIKFFAEFNFSGKTKELQEFLKYKNFICIDSHIFCPDNLTFQELAFNCSPILVSLKNRCDFNKIDIKQGLAVVGVSEKVTLNQIQNYFKKMIEKKNLEKLEVEVYINMLRLYCNIFPNTIDSECCLPDKTRKLQPYSHLCFLDIKVLKDIHETHSFVHESVPLEILDYFNIPSYSQKKLHKMSTFMSFGQKEELVVRLRNIIKEYKFDITLFNELIQNAEDAGATEVHFIIDKRQHSTKGILDEKYKEAQGPALCVFNDSCFSEKDLIGIQNLGSGSKAKDPSKIGQFGLGFNVVYNVTDVPSFLTIGKNVPGGGTFCVFDPLFSYCACKNYEKPGIRIQNIDHLKSNYPGVYDCYLQGKNELPHEQGTWFRFPLRTMAMAKKSEIKNEEISVESILQMFEKFKKEINLSLIFLRSVRKITFSSIDYKKGLQKLAESISTISCKHSDVVNFHESALKNAENLSNISETQEICYTLDIMGPKKQSWLVSSVFGYKGERCLPSELKYYIEEGHIQLPPDCSVAIPLQPQVKHLKGKLFCSLPLPSETRLPVHINGRFSLTSNRISLFYDKKDQKTPNGLWNEFLLEVLVAKSYHNAIEWIKNNMINGNNIDFYYSIFPVPYENVHVFVGEKISQGFFQLILNSESPIWPIESDGKIDWVSIRGKHEFDHIFVDNIFEHYFKSIQSSLEVIKRRTFFDLSQKSAIIKDLEEKTNQRAICLRKQLKLMNLKLVSLPTFLLKSLNHSLNKEFLVQVISPKLVLMFLKKCVTISTNDNVSHIQSTCFQSIEILCEVFSYVQTEIKDVRDLQGLPLCLMQDETLKVFGSVPCLVSKYQSLLPGSKGKFLHESLIELLPAHIRSISDSTIQKLNLSVFKREFSDSFDINQVIGAKPIVYEARQNMPNIEWYKTFWNFIIKEQIEIDLVKKELDEWRMITGYTCNRIYLAPIKCGYFFCQKIEKDYSLKFRNMQDTFLQIDLPFGDPFVPLPLIAKFDKPESVLQYLHVHKLHLKHASKKTSNMLLSYFDDNIRFPDLESEEIEKFKMLPLLFIGERAFPICYFNAIYILNIPEIPSQGLNDFTLKSKTALVQNMYLSKSFIKKFNIKNINTIQKFYADLLQELVCVLDVKDIEKHLDFLVTSGYFKVQPLTDALKSIKLIKTKDDICVKASEFYDSSLNIFRELCDGSELLPPPYNKETYLDLMKNAGLQTTVTISKFKEFSLKISKFDARDKKALILSEVLFTHLKNIDAFEVKEFLKEIKDIKCIVPEKVDKFYQDICPQYQCARLVSYSEAVHKNELLLVWSSLPLLPAYAYESEFLMKPQLKDVCSHIHRVCLSLSTNKDLLLKLKDNIGFIMERFYKYLSDKDVQQVKYHLQETPFVYIEDQNIFAYSSQVSMDAKVTELIPYLFEIPIKYASYFDLFKVFGATKTISIRQLVHVLNTIAKDIKQTNMKLVPKEIKCVEKAYDKFLTLLCEKKLDCEQEVNEIEEMFLVSSTGALHKSNEMLFGDTLDWAKRLEKESSIIMLKNVLQETDELQIIFECFSERIKPKFLSNTIEEKIVEFATSTQLCENIVKLKSILKNKRFLGILKAACRNLVEETELLMIEGNIQNLIIEGAKCLKTVLIFEKTKLKNTETIKHAFFLLKEGKPTLYLLEDEHEFTFWMRSVQVDLIYMLQKCTCGLIEKFKLKQIVQNLHCMEILEELFLEETSTKKLPFYKDLLGTYVSKDLYETLIQDFVSFEKAEIVALEVYAPDEEEIDDLQFQDPLYIFVEVIDCTNKEDDLLDQVFHVDTGQCITNSSFLDLYKFKRKKDKNSSFDIETFSEGLQHLDLSKLSEPKKNVLKMFCQSWKLSMKERKKFIKRQRLNWHPDKNPGKEVLCEEMTKFIHDVIRRLEEGQLDDLLGKLNKHDCCQNWTYGTESHQLAGEYFSFSKNVSCRSKNKKSRSAQQFCEEANPVPEEANRYLKQAKQDFLVAQYLFDQGNAPSCHNWIIYLCHQACEKSIKAYGWANDSKKMNVKSHNLRGILDCTPGFILEMIPKFFQPSNYMGLRYPDPLKLPYIPKEVFQKEDLTIILSATGELLSNIDEKMP